MEAVFDLMHKARRAILFLVFQSGQPSIVTEAAKIARQNENLFVHGASTDPKAAQQFNSTVLTHRGADTVFNAGSVAASAIKDQFGQWQKELLSAGHAIIHDKIVVIDPFDADCIVVTGSHNLGYRASYNNNENLVIVKGNRALAAAYAAHVMDVYDHYRWRYSLQSKQGTVWSGLASSDSWQDKYLRQGSPAANELDFWLNLPLPGDSQTTNEDEGAPAPSKRAPAKKKTKTIRKPKKARAQS
jgi:phosphatidylserine/phosphatidylglycerophosphate/cardiolipin synthase-like enzyme